MRLQCLNQILDWKERDMGKVRPEHVKRLARKLIERFPDKFTTEFEHNKKGSTLSPIFLQQNSETEWRGIQFN